MIWRFDAEAMVLLELALAADGGIGIDYYLVLRDDACGVSRRMVTSSGATSYTYAPGPTHGGVGLVFQEPRFGNASLCS